VPAASFEVPIRPLPPKRFQPLLGDRYSETEAAIDRARELLAGRTIWHLNSTDRGGGVVELLRSLLAYAAGAGVSVRWLVVTGSPEFFTITKRLHNQLHGTPGDGGALDAAARAVYVETLRRNADEIRNLMREGDVVVCHDPQTAGLVPTLRELAGGVLWRCHVGIDEPNEIARAAWDFLRPWVEQADGVIFSRQEFVWEGLDPSRIFISAPVIDAFSPKNQELAPETCVAILQQARLLDGKPSEEPSFAREDGTSARVTHFAEVDQDRPLRRDDRIVCQVSRWDGLKDPLGVIRALAGRVRGRDDVHLLLAGPGAGTVSDDPESAAVLADARAARAALEPAARDRVHLASLPMDDLEENAAIVNALQRHSEIVVQKSLAEGFGLTVAEAMWKRRPVVASRVGGIQDQIVEGCGILVDPRDLDAFADAVSGLLDDPERARAMGEAAQIRVREHFLATASLVRYLGFIEWLLTEAGARPAPAS
jgi:trehalose synthase